MYLFSNGLAQEVRRFLKFDADDGDKMTSDQLDLWPRHLRGSVNDIGMARVFVPSRNEFVLLTPTTIGKADVGEAGHYLIAKGRDCIRRGKSLISLCELM